MAPRRVLGVCRPLLVDLAARSTRMPRWEGAGRRASCLAGAQLCTAMLTMTGSGSRGCDRAQARQGAGSRKRRERGVLMWSDLAISDGADLVSPLLNTSLRALCYSLIRSSFRGFR